MELNIPAGYYDPPAQAEEPDSLPTRCATCGCYLPYEYQAEFDYEEGVRHPRVVWFVTCRRCGTMAKVVV